MKKTYIHSVLFVVGAPGAGKSATLRSLFLDSRLGTDGKIPTANKLKTFYPLVPVGSLF